MQILNLDLIEYSEATRLQLQLVEDVADGGEEAVILCRHPRIVTVGRATKPSDLSGWSGRIAETARGGRATYHGPAQIVIYPILNLRQRRRDVAARDLHGYMRSLETVVCGALQEIGVAGAESRTTVRPGEPSQTGVWVGEHKIASIGIAVRKWVTYHGCAINVERDPEAFRGIQPCGFHSSVMTSVEERLGEARRAHLLQALERRIQTSFMSDAVDNLSQANTFN